MVKTAALYLLSIKSYLENGKVSSILKRIVLHFRNAGVSSVKSAPHSSGNLFETFPSAPKYNLMTSI
jgi:hypothetical protein